MIFYYEFLLFLFIYIYIYIYVYKKLIIYIYKFYFLLYNLLITSTLRFRSEFAAARRFAKTNHQKTGLFLAIFVDFCPIRRSHWESCFPCGGSRLLNPGRNFAVFLEIAFSTVPKNCRKFGSA